MHLWMDVSKIKSSRCERGKMKLKLKRIPWQTQMMDERTKGNIQAHICWGAELTNKAEVVKKNILQVSEQDLWKRWPCQRKTEDFRCRQTYLQRIHEF